MLSQLEVGVCSLGWSIIVDNASVMYPEGGEFVSVCYGGNFQVIGEGSDTDDGVVWRCKAFRDNQRGKLKR